MKGAYIITPKLRPGFDIPQIEETILGLERSKYVYQSHNLRHSQNCKDSTVSYARSNAKENDLSKDLGLKSLNLTLMPKYRLVLKPLSSSKRMLMPG